MKKLLATLFTVTLILICAAIPACAAETQEELPPATAPNFFGTLNNVFNYFFDFMENLFVPEQEKPALVAQDGKENDIVIDREKNIVYGFHGRLRVHTVGDFIKVSNEELGRLEFVQKYNNRIGSGDKVNVVDNKTNETVESFTIVYFGDVNGDGVCNVMDDITVRQEADGETSWSDPDSPDYCYWMFLAADLDKDGVITEEDEQLIVRCVVGAVRVDQATGTVMTTNLCLVAQLGKEDTVVVDTENKVVYGITRGAKSLDDFVKVGNRDKGKLEFVQKFSNRISSGDKINVIDSKTNEISETYTVVIFGDVHENGRYCFTDIKAILREAAGKTSWSDPDSADYCYWKTLAADLDKDGIVTIKDYNLMKKCIFGFKKVNQTTGEII